jgi:hypothetical protein
VQKRAHIAASPDTERSLEPALRFRPSPHTRLKASLAGFAHPHHLAAPVACALLGSYQAVAFQWQEIPAERGAVHDHLRSEGIDRHGTCPPQLCENRKLRRS